MKRNYLKITLSILGPLLAILYMENKCMKCHVPWKGVNNTACIECHVDDKHYMRNELEPNVAGQLRCFDCHQEHRGKSYDLEVAEYLPPKC